MKRIGASRLQIEIKPALETQRKLPFHVVLHSTRLRVRLRGTAHDNYVTFTLPLCSCLALCCDCQLAGRRGLGWPVPGRSALVCVGERRKAACEEGRGWRRGAVSGCEPRALLPKANRFQKQTPLALYCFICSRVFTEPARIIPALMYSDDA